MQRIFAKLDETPCYHCEEHEVYQEALVGIFFCLNCGTTARIGQMPEHVRNELKEGIANAHEVYLGETH